MLDHGFTPRTTVTQTQTFYALGATGTVEWQTWTKPRNIVLVHIRCIGAGGGGGGGHTAAAGVARGGGGGGGSGAITDVLIPSMFLPDVLYVMVGRGGLGGAATAAGTAGDRSFVCMQPQAVPTIPMNICSSGAAAAGGGGAGTVGAAGTAGVAGTIAVAAGALGHNLGLFMPRVGQIGALGGAHTGATGVAVIHAGTGLPITGGSGGGGTPVANTDFAGGAITGVAGTLMPTLNGGVAAAGAGQHGIFFSGNPLWTATGGTGGGTAGAAGVGGRGGDASFGSGGGGGGGGVTGGAGGRGGDGQVIICCW